MIIVLKNLKKTKESIWIKNKEEVSVVGKYSGVNVKVFDSDFLNSGKILKNHCEELEQLVVQYKLCLTNIWYNAIPAGQVHDTLGLYITYVSRLEGKAKYLGKKIKSLTKNYINAFDDADDYLYVKGSSVVRKFTEEEYAKMKKLLKEPWYSSGILDGLSNWAIGIEMKYFGRWNMKNPKQSLKDTKRALLDYHDATLESINYIFDNVNNVENTYGKGDSSYFGLCLLTIKAYRDALKELAYIIEPGKGRFNPDTIRSRLDSVFANLEKYYGETMEIYDPSVDASIGEIEDFLSQPWASSYFQTFMGPISMFFGDLGGYEEAKAYIFNMFDAAEAELTKGGYEKNLLKQELMSMLSDMANTYKYTNSQQQKDVKFYKELLKLSKGEGEEWYKTLDKRTKNAKQLKKFIKTLGGLEKIYKYGDAGFELVATLFCNYEKNLELLNAFEKTDSASPLMSECIREIKGLYNKQLEQILGEILSKVKDLGVEATIDLAADAFVPVAVVKAIRLIVDEAGEISGLGTKSKAMMRALTLNNIYNQSLDAYSIAVEKAKEALKNNPNSSPITLLRQVQNTFNLVKKSAQDMFEAMAASTSGKKRAYYKYCADVARDARINSKLNTNDRGMLHLMSYEEFLKKY